MSSQAKRNFFNKFPDFKVNDIITLDGKEFMRVVEVKDFAYIDKSYLYGVEYLSGSRLGIIVIIDLRNFDGRWRLATRNEKLAVLL